MFNEKEGLEGEEIYLYLKRTAEANPKKGYVPAYYFEIYRISNNIKMGCCNLRIRHNENTNFGGNIGYAIDEKFRGHYYAGKACLLLMDFAREHKMIC